MKDYEKFEARLHELGIYEEWCKQGSFGRIGAHTLRGISILVHEGDDDKYSEFAYPPMSVMQEDVDFRLRALNEFCDHDDEHFVYKLCKWVAEPRNPCPLYPVDVYFPWSNAEVTDFEDDDETEVMDCSNNHHPFLVYDINKAYANRKDDFLQIVQLLAKRDGEEELLAKRNEHTLCHEYCQHVADDDDLRTILLYCKPFTK